MKQKTALLLFFLLTLTGCATEAFEDEPMSLTANLINKSPKADKQPVEEEVNPNAARLWFHVRNEQQQQFIESLEEQLKSDDNIVIEPVQFVEAGPRKTQLRFFTVQDKERAKELLKKFKKFFPNLQLLDLSYQYGASIMPGHFELWLAPDLQTIPLPPKDSTTATGQGKPSVSVTKP